MTVKKVPGGYKVKSKTKGYLSRKPKTKAGAARQHKAVMASKKRRGHTGGCGGK